MLLDTFLPRYDVRECHQTQISAAPEQVYAILRSVDLGGSRWVRGLLRIRGLPASALNLEGLLELGFFILGKAPGEELVLGSAGRFWNPSPELQRLSPGEFLSFQRPGCAKAAWNLRVTALSENETLLSTETRVLCLVASGRRWFRLYWLLIRPFSGWIRQALLHAVKRRAEAGP